METEYNQFDSGQSANKVNKGLVALVILTCILLLGSIIFIAVYVSNNSSTSNEEYCDSPICLELASELATSMNSSVDPCEDFYHYVCDGFDAENAWEDLDYASYGNFEKVTELEKETFLNAIFYNTKKDLVDYSSVAKATNFMAKCFESTLELEDEETNNYLTKLLTDIEFASDLTATWDDSTVEGFQYVMKYLTQINWNTLFSLYPSQEKVVFFQQILDYWDPNVFSQINYTQIIYEDYVPLYQSIFNLSLESSRYVANLVVDFTYNVENITTIDYDYYDYNSYVAMIRAKNFSNIADILGNGNVMNYTKLVYDVFEASANDLSDGYLVYFTKGATFFQRLATLIENTPPFTVQLYLYTSILVYYYNFEDTVVTQSRYTDRTDFCFTRTINEFPYVYGYILNNELYSDELHATASNLASDVLTEGTKVLINNATWLDSDSLAAALKKVEYMKLYIGFPDQIQNGSAVDGYYKLAEQNSSISWIDNTELLNTFAYKQQLAIFWGTSYDIISPWPSDFSQPSSYGAWLTGVNAFYTPLGNWFTIPITISQKPFLNNDYPSSINYGGLGAVCGHEMSHGFDPSGSQYDYAGNYVTSIFTESTQIQYNEKLECFKEQYNDIPIGVTSSGDIIYDNGTRTITENVADNAGLWSSWTAWKSQIKTNGNDKLLYGIDANQQQLFFIGWARVWCEASRPAAYANWTDVHSPNYARVIVPLQNNIHFADAFSCSKGSRMNPNDKCLVW